MNNQVNLITRNLRYVLSIGLAAATLAVVLTYVLGAPAFLQTAQAEEGHKLFMSMFMPLIQAITGGHSSMAQMHGGGAPISESTMEKMPEPQVQEMQRRGTMGLIGNNILGSPATPSAGGLAVNVVAGAITFAIAAFAISWKQRSYSGIAYGKWHNPYDTTSSEHELYDSWSYNWSDSRAHYSRTWRGKGYQNNKGCSGSSHVIFFHIMMKLSLIISAIVAVASSHK